MTGLVTVNYNDSKKAVALANKCIDQHIFDYVVIIDNASKKDDVLYLKENLNKKVILIENEKNVGFARGNNIGLKYLVENLHCEYGLVCCTDIIFEKESIENCINVLKDKKCSAVTILKKEYDGSESDCFWNFQKPMQYYNRFFLIKNKFFRKKEKTIKEDKDFFYCDCIRGSFMFFNLNDLKNADYFDEHTFLYYEEEILLWKFKQNNLKVGVISTDYYIHNHPTKKKTKCNIFVLKETYKSLYYYLSNYRNINFIQKFFYKIISNISILEFRILNLFKK